MNGKELLVAIEPVIDLVADLEKRIDARPVLNGTDGKDGRDGKDGADGISPDPAVIIEKLHATYGESLKGADGKDGRDGKDGADGAPGADADCDEIVVKLLASHADALRGFPGKDGQDGVGICAPIHEKGAIYRADSLVVAHIGRYYVALKDTCAEPGDSADWQRVGTAGLRHRGAFDKDASYEVGDMYAKDFGTFLVNGPDDHILLCSRGSKGERGPVGLPGADGAAGASGSRIISVTAKGAGIAIGMQHADGEIEVEIVDFSEAFKAMVQEAVVAALAAL
jgi:hypothetical protein